MIARLIAYYTSSELLRIPRSSMILDLWKLTVLMEIWRRNEIKKAARPSFFIGELLRNGLGCPRIVSLWTELQRITPEVMLQVPFTDAMTQGNWHCCEGWRLSGGFKELHRGEDSPENLGPDQPLPASLDMRSSRKG